MPFFSSSIGKKALMAVTGLFLLGFVVAHMLGNLQIYLGPDRLNDYAEHLQEMPYLLWPARVFLLAALAAHMVVAAKLTMENKNARPRPYACKDTVQASYASRTMMMSGVIIFAFIVYHLLHYTFGVTNPEQYALTDAKGRHDVYSMVVTGFRNIYISLAYILAMVPLCLHLGHGLQSFPQSLGFDTEKHECAVKCFARFFSFAVFFGNCSIPVSVLLHILTIPAKGA